MKERSLVLFSLLAQGSVGIFVSTTILQVSLAFRTDRQLILGTSIFQLAINLFAFAFFLAGASLLIALTHLGTPTRAWRAVQNFSHSWLSREIVFGLLFTFFAGMTLLSLLLPTMLSISLATSQLSGLICAVTFIYSMGRVYMQRTIPGWNTRQTLLTFLLTVASTGMLVTALALSKLPVSQDPWHTTAMLVSSYSAALALISQILNQVWVQRRYEAADRRCPGQRALPASPDQLMRWHPPVALAAAITIALTTWLPEYRSTLLLLALCLALLGEFIARKSFFTSYCRTGL